MCHLQDVQKMISMLPNVFASYDVPYKKWNHMDYLWGIDADTLVYAEVLKNIPFYAKQCDTDMAFFNRISDTTPKYFESNVRFL